MSNTKEPNNVKNVQRTTDHLREIDTLKVVGRCAGCNLAKGWDEFCLMPAREGERCPAPATYLYDNGVETIPLCGEHYNAWFADTPSKDASSPLWDLYRP